MYVRGSIVIVVQKNPFLYLKKFNKLIIEKLIIKIKCEDFFLS